eukprot:TRINITY_DN773185_c0_g1_i1.p1 TRINITY_DN773185_c0_g1~~TRINITY_DN773185_c0_g1_i1.p1  ORF type:complete len:554 (-),score=143.22 TRINITY_DN773185_c0_g1_i1:179-1840(-)
MNIPNFSDASTSVSIPSTWKRRKRMTHVRTQTTDVRKKEVGCQSRTYATSETATEDTTQVLGKDVFDLSSMENNVKEFLDSVSGEVIKQLERNQRSHAFVDYDHMIGDEDTNGILHELRFESEKESQCTALAWNATGSTVIGCFGTNFHDDICDHNSHVCLWNIFASDFDPNVPQKVIDMPSCIMSIAAHPENPSIFALGCFNGEIYLADTNSSEIIIGNSNILDFFHREPVTDLKWVRKMVTGGKKTHVLVSVGADKHVLFWDIEDKKKMRYPKMGSSFLSRSGGDRSAKLAKRWVPVRMAFCEGSSLMTGSLMVGCESGAVLKCLIHRNINKMLIQRDSRFRWSHGAREVMALVPPTNQFGVREKVERYVQTVGKNSISGETIFHAQPTHEQLYPPAVDFQFSDHGGRVYGLDASPIHRNLFASASSDCTVQVRSQLQKSPLIHLTCSNGACLDVSWSHSRPLVFAVACGDGSVLLFDLMTNQASHVVNLSSSESKSKAAKVAIEFNPRQRRLLACGGNDGTIEVWRLDWKLSETQPGESAALKKLLGEDA